MSSSDVILRTPRLTLRGYQPDDAPTLSGLLGDPLAARYLFAGVPLDEHEAICFIKEQFTFGAKPTGLGSLVESSTQTVIGFAGLLACAYLGEDDLEFGFALATTAWGKGYATEIGQRQIQYGFEDLQKTRLLALTHPANLASQRVLTKLKLIRLTRVDIANRGPRDVYVISRPDLQSNT